MKTETIDLFKLEENAENPRKITDSKADKLIDSILIFPRMLEIRPIVIDDTFKILGGNMRFRALQAIANMSTSEISANLSKCPGYNDKTELERDTLLNYWIHWINRPVVYVINASELSQKERKEFIIKDNTGFGEWDWSRLSTDWDLSELENWGVELPADWDTSEAEEQKEAEDDDFSDEDAEKAEPRVKLGEIWQLGEHRLMCGDSTDADSVALLMDGEKADMVLSDPPYGMHLDTDFSSCLGSLGRKKGSRGNRYEKVIGDNDDFSPALISTFFLNFNETKEMFIFGADYFAELLPNKNNGSWLVWDKRKESQADAIGSEFELIWSKNKHKRRVLRHDWFGFLSSGNSQDARNRVHPTQKPVTLLTDIINQWGKDVESIVDLYGGSGTTLIACEQLNRKCYMMELSEHYASVIIARWEKLTGKEAVKVYG